MQIAAFDIETDTAVDGRDPSRTTVVAVATVVVDDAAAVVGSFVATGEEASVISAFAAHLSALNVDAFATWNGSGFDLPMLADRAARCGIELPWTLTPSTRAGKYPPLPGHAGTYRAVINSRPHVDIAYPYQAVAREAAVSWSLKPIARLHGLDPIEVDREAIHELSAADTVAYVSSDAAVTALLALSVDLATWADHTH